MFLNYVHRFDRAAVAHLNANETSQVQLWQKREKLCRLARFPFSWILLFDLRQINTASPAEQLRDMTRKMIFWKSQKK